MKKILVIGSINMDLVIRTDKLPAMGETLNGKGFSTVPGGKGANQAVAAARLGCDVSMIGAVGDDIYGKQLLENLKANNIKTDGIAVCNTNSGIAVITVYQGDNAIILDHGANFCVDPAMIDKNKHLIEEADVVVMQFEIPMETVLYAAKLAKSIGKFVIINPAPYTEIPDELYLYSDIFIPNQHEAQQLLGIDVPDLDATKNALKMLKEKGISYPIITLGKDGSACLTENGIKVTPPYKVKAVDSTGAGDSFIGGLCKGLSDGLKLLDCIKYATKVSAITVTGFGATNSFPTAKKVEELYGNK